MEAEERIRAKRRASNTSAAARHTHPSVRHQTAGPGVLYSVWSAKQLLKTCGCEGEVQMGP